MNKLIKVFKGVFKSFDAENHTATVVVSTGSVDRDQEIVAPESFKSRIKTYLAHPVFLACHNPYALENQIGEAKGVEITNSGLEVTFEWYAGKGNKTADWAWFLAQKQIAAFSVGMMIHGYEEGKRNSDGSYVNSVRRTYTDVELLEISQVLIPSNRDAVMDGRSKAQHEEAEMLELAIKSIKDEEWRPVEKVLTKDEVQQMVRDAVDKVKDIIISEVVGQLTEQSSLGDEAQPLVSPTMDDVKSWIIEAVKQIK